MKNWNKHSASTVRALNSWVENHKASGFAEQNYFLSGPGFFSWGQSTLNSYIFLNLEPSILFFMYFLEKQVSSANKDAFRKLENKIYL